MKVDLVNSLIVGVLCCICVYQQVQIGNLQGDVIEFKNAQIVAANNNQQPGVSRQLRKSKEKTDTVAVSSDRKSPPPKVPAFEKNENENRVMDATKKVGANGIYGGAGDEVHLGGFTQRDNNTISFNLWNYMLGPMAVKSFLDVGCGRGFSTNYFRERGAKVLCVEGSHDALKHTLLPRSDIVQHDYTKGPLLCSENLVCLDFNFFFLLRRVVARGHLRCGLEYRVSGTSGQTAHEELHGHFQASGIRVHHW